MAPPCRVVGFIMLAVLLGACHAESSVEATDVTVPPTTTTTTTSTTTSVKADTDVVNVSEKETVVAPTDMPTALSNSTSLPPVEDKGVDDKLSPSSSPSPSTVGRDKEKEGDDKEDEKDKEKEETDEEKKEKGEPLEVDDMMKNPYSNDTVEDSTTVHADKDTVTVVDSHVVDSKKTHEDAAAENKTTTSSQPTRITDQPVSRVFMSESTVGTPVMALVVDHSDHDHLSPGKTSPFAQPTATAAILAGVLIGVAVAGYVGLVAWRKFLEKRYGNREMLVNEDDDMHHFEL